MGSTLWTLLAVSQVLSVALRVRVPAGVAGGKMTPVIVGVLLLSKNQSVLSLLSYQKAFRMNISTFTKESIPFPFFVCYPYSQKVMH